MSRLEEDVRRHIVQAERFAQAGHLSDAIARAKQASATLDALEADTALPWGAPQLALKRQLASRIATWENAFREMRRTLEQKRWEKVRAAEELEKEPLPPL